MNAQTYNQSIDKTNTQKINSQTNKKTQTLYQNHDQVYKSKQLSICQTKIVAFAVVFGVSAFPDMYTVIGGAVLLLGTLLVTWATRHEGKEHSHTQTAAAMQSIDHIELELRSQLLLETREGLIRHFEFNFAFVFSPLKKKKQ